MPPRKLPPYETLRSLVVDQGQSYASIAKRYGVGYDRVYRVLKQDACKAGDPWPIVRDFTKVVQRGIEASTIETVWLRESLLEAYEDAQQDFMPAEVYLSARRVELASTQPKSQAHYHRPGCVFIAGAEVLKMDYESAAKHPQYEPCATCCRRLSITEWSKQIGIDKSHLVAVMNKGITRVRKSTAVKMMRAIGEEPHSSLLEWRPNCQARKRRSPDEAPVQP